MHVKDSKKSPRQVILQKNKNKTNKKKKNQFEPFRCSAILVEGSSNNYYADSRLVEQVLVYGSEFNGTQATCTGGSAVMAEKSLVFTMLDSIFINNTGREGTIGFIQFGLSMIMNIDMYIRF